MTKEEDKIPQQSKKPRKKRQGDWRHIEDDPSYPMYSPSIEQGQKEAARFRRLEQGVEIRIRHRDPDGHNAGRRAVEEDYEGFDPEE
jgi:hypothetical protein